MQLNDTKIDEFGKQDGIKSIYHCQETFFIIFRCEIGPSDKNFENHLTWLILFKDKLNYSIFAFQIINVTGSLIQIILNAFYIKLQFNCILLVEETHTLEYEKKLQFCLNIVMKKQDR